MNAKLVYSSAMERGEERSAYQEIFYERPSTLRPAVGGRCAGVSEVLSRES
jgi:hypothetical protein